MKLKIESHEHLLHGEKQTDGTTASSLFFFEFVCNVDAADITEAEWDAGSVIFCHGVISVRLLVILRESCAIRL